MAANGNHIERCFISLQSVCLNIYIYIHTALNGYKKIDVCVHYSKGYNHSIYPILNKYIKSANSSLIILPNMIGLPKTKSSVLLPINTDLIVETLDIFVIGK